MPNNLNLADPDFFEPLEIDLLLGADCFWNLLEVGHVNLSASGLIMRNTKLGWVIAGPMNQREPPQARCFLATEVSQQIARFWELEEVAVASRFSADEVACEEHFLNTTERDSTGRFVVKMPLRADTELGESYNGALKRLLRLERKLERSPSTRQPYSAFMAEYAELGHMKKVGNPNTRAPIFYLPHHAVYSASSTTTKMRVVIDGSAKTTSGIWLNDQQLVGPVIQPDIFSILLRFRRHAFVVTADIAKMYRQLLIAPEQRPLQRILWRADKADRISTYELQTVTYGTASASFLSIRCLHALADDIAASQQPIANIIKSDFYVDDLLTGSDNKNELQSDCREVERDLAGGGFQLHKWRSNCAELLSKFNYAARSSTLALESETRGNTLGLLWDSSSDSFAYHIPVEQHDVITKRTMVAQLARIFDPLGLLAPCIIIGKVLLQRLWLEKVEWNDPLPEELQSTWAQFTANLKELNTISVPRHAFAVPNPVNIQIHGFCDASKSAYGACLYIRATSIEGRIITALTCAKTKVAPLKTVSIPRLELCAAALLAKLLRKFIGAIERPAHGIFLWSDVMVVLAWLKTPPFKSNTFVANRVAEIQQLPQIVQWKRVPTRENPAHLLSRGTLPEGLAACSLWWDGPKWLSEPESHWPAGKDRSSEPLPELRKAEQPTNRCMIIHATAFPTFEKYSSYSKLKRIIAYVLRFVSKCKLQSQEKSHLTIAELRVAERTIVRVLQKRHFSDELTQLQIQKETTRLAVDQIATLP